MKLVFWNVQRLGGGTPQARRQVIEDLVAKRVKPDYAIFCELLQNIDFPTPYNLTYRRENPRQLCYGCIDTNGNSYQLKSYTPSATDDYKKAGFKGGNDFKQLADRSVAYFAKVGGVDVYAIHAPAGKGSAQKAMSFVACDLNQSFVNKPWLLLGDFNVEPNILASSKVGIDLSSITAAPNEPTKIGKRRDRTLDYVLCNFVGSVSVSRVRCSPRTVGSDHYPILVEW